MKSEREYVSSEMIEKARELDLYSYLKIAEPEELVRSQTGEYSTRTHDSLKISNGKWFWWSRGIGGKSALDYLVKVKGEDFVSAVKKLNGDRAWTVEAPPVFVSEKRKEYEKLYLPWRNFACEKARTYLRSRAISEKIIEECIRKKMISEDAHGNVMFIGYDENGKAKHASLRATDGGSFKKDVAGSDKRYVFRLLSDHTPDTVYVFEGAVDLLSYATLLSEKGYDYHAYDLISLSGIYLPKEQMSETKIPFGLSHYLEKHPNTKRIRLCFDNDFTGRRCAEALQTILGSTYKVQYIPPPAGKDYNDFLQMRAREREGKNEQIQSDDYGDSEKDGRDRSRKQEPSREDRR